MNPEQAVEYALAATDPAPLAGGAQRMEMRPPALLGDADRDGFPVRAAGGVLRGA